MPQTRKCAAKMSFDIYFTVYLQASLFIGRLSATVTSEQLHKSLRVLSKASEQHKKDDQCHRRSPSKGSHHYRKRSISPSKSHVNHHHKRRRSKSPRLLEAPLRHREQSESSSRDSRKQRSRSPFSNSFTGHNRPLQKMDEKQEEEEGDKTEKKTELCSSSLWPLVRVVKHLITGESRGYAFAWFKSANQADGVLKLWRQLSSKRHSFHQRKSLDLADAFVDIIGWQQVR